MYINHSIIFRHGAPAIIQSDNGLEFRNSLVDEICNTLGTDHRFSSPYRPQTNGLVERTNGNLVNKLSKLANEDINNWDFYLPQTVFAINITINRTTTFSPFEMNYGRKPALPLSYMDFYENLSFDPVEEETIRLSTIKRKQSIMPKINVGDKVMIKIKTIKVKP